MNQSTEKTLNIDGVKYVLFMFSKILTIPDAEAQRIALQNLLSVSPVVAESLRILLVEYSVTQSYVVNKQFDQLLSGTNFNLMH